MGNHCCHPGPASQNVLQTAPSESLTKDQDDLHCPHRSDVTSLLKYMIVMYREPRLPAGTRFPPGAPDQTVLICNKKINVIYDVAPDSSHRCSRMKLHLIMNRKPWLPHPLPSISDHVLQTTPAGSVQNISTCLWSAPHCCHRWIPYQIFLYHHERIQSCHARQHRQLPAKK